LGIAETEEAAPAKSVSFQREQALIGTPDMVRQGMAEYKQAGAQEMILWMPDAKDLQSIQPFARECM
jgi:alkanesulfonate monooxygenase SsuD/methylene tetrahydromethanopterin reductase-like flavin-dependent oxidoreductase (luciferase family)